MHDTFVINLWQQTCIDWIVWVRLQHKRINEFDLRKECKVAMKLNQRRSLTSNTTLSQEI